MKDVLIMICVILTIMVWFAVWIAGVVLAKGFLSTLLAVTTGGLWSAYLIFEVFLDKAGWL